MSLVNIREATIEDESLVQKLCKRNGLGGERIDNAWEWIWGKNINYIDEWPIGWVLECSKDIVGFIGNVPRSYSFKGKKLIAGVARAFVVDYEFRSYSLQLVALFFSQKSADLLIFSSANASAGDIYNLAKAKKLPQPDYDEIMYWVLSPKLFLYTAFCKKGLGSMLSALVSVILTPVFYIEMVYRKRWSHVRSKDVEIISPQDLEHDFDDFWRDLKGLNYNRLLSCRDYNSIQWQFVNDSAAICDPKLFILRKEKVICGYAIVTRGDVLEYGLKRLIVTDLIVLGDREDFIKELFNEVVFYAKTQKIVLLDMIGFPSVVRRTVKSFYPFVRNIPYFPFWYYSKNSDLNDEFEQEAIWYTSTFDGDSSI